MGGRGLDQRLYSTSVCKILAAILLATSHTDRGERRIHLSHSLPTPVIARRLSHATRSRVERSLRSPVILVRVQEHLQSQASHLMSRSHQVILRHYRKYNDNRAAEDRDSV